MAFISLRLSELILKKGEDTIKKKYTVLHTIILLLIVFLIAFIERTLKENVYADAYLYLLSLSSFLFITLGFFSSNKFISMFYKKYIIDFKRLIIGLIVSIVGLVPVAQWFFWFGIVSTEFINSWLLILQSIYANHAINVLAGVIIAKSIVIKDEN